MKRKSFLILILIYVISFISIRFGINLFYPYYLIKDIIFFPVNALEKDIILSNELEEGINLELKNEYDELKKLNDLSNTLIDFDKVSALVIERNKMYWFNTIIINKGSSSGIKENMAVITGDGLIGRINKVSKTTSEVKLLTTNDVNNKISVMIKTDNDTIYGILSGYNVDENYLQVTSINKNINNLDNNLVYTSGMGGIFPSGILIGKVSGTIDDKYNVSKVIKVTPISDYNNTRFVNVLIRKE